jgi:succinate dehydrogenase / fumarate reductase flavoprotein subunit
LARPPSEANPYEIHRRLGDVMTRTATVIRHNADLAAAYEEVSKLEDECRRASVTDVRGWTNQNVTFLRTLQDMFPVAKTILKGALDRNECRGAHYKPEYAPPELTGSTPGELRQQAEAWCERFDENNCRWLKTTVATLSPDGEPVLSYEDVDTSIIPPRPRLYGLAGASIIEEVWKERQARKRQLQPA